MIFPEPAIPGVCEECGNPTGDAGSICGRCARELAEARGEVLGRALDADPFLLEDDE